METTIKTDPGCDVVAVDEALPVISEQTPAAPVELDGLNIGGIWVQCIQ